MRKVLKRPVSLDSAKNTETYTFLSFKKGYPIAFLATDIPYFLSLAFF